MRRGGWRGRRGSSGWAARFVFGVAALFGLGVGCDLDSSRDTPCAKSTPAAIALLAVGDFGQPPSPFPLLGRREAVSSAIDREHACRPADALVLLGDNFYPEGLTDKNFEARVRDTLVAPFCRFLSLEGVRGQKLSSACPLAQDLRHPVPVLAVMGNHDYEPPVDGRLEKLTLPAWIPEWQMPSGLAQVFEISSAAGGISVIAIDSVRLHEGAEFGPVRDALGRARGRYRILIAHHPLTVDGQPFEARYTEGILQAIKESGRRVHLLLAGHEHHLALSATGLSELPLQAVVGSGARVRGASHVLLGRAERWHQLGFARLSVNEAGALEIELFAASRWDRVSGRAPALVARMRVSEDDRVLQDGDERDADESEAASRSGSGRVHVDPSVESAPQPSGLTMISE